MSKLFLLHCCPLSPAVDSYSGEGKEEEKKEEEEEMETSSLDVLLLDKIPEDCQKGWWRTTSQDTIRQILLNLNSRGIRERNLQKQFHRFLSDSKELLKSMPNDEGEIYGRAFF